MNKVLIWSALASMCFLPFAWAQDEGARGDVPAQPSVAPQAAAPKDPETILIEDLRRMGGGAAPSGAAPRTTQEARPAPAADDGLYFPSMRKGS
jgi:hypothetical protein